MAHDNIGITKLKNGRWEIRVSAVNPRTKKLVYLRRRFRGKLNQARVRRDELRDQLRDELRVEVLEPAASRPRLDDCVESYLEYKERRVRPSVGERYAYELAHATSKLGQLFIDDITTQDIEDWFKGMEGTAEVVTLNSRLKTLTVCLARECRKLGIPNPAELVEPLPEPKGPGKGLEVEDLRALLAAYVHEETRPLVETLAYTGMRWGEASALRWDDIDRKNMVITIERSHWRNTLNPPKNGRVRKVPMCATLDESLQVHRQRLMEKQDPGFEQGYCFATVPTRGPNKGAVRLRTPSSVARPWKAACDAAKVTASPKMLRHTFVDLLRRAKADAIVEHAIVGHADERTRERYSHARVSETAPFVEAAVRLVQEKK